MTPSSIVQIFLASAFFLGSRNVFQPVRSLPLNSLIQPWSLSSASTTGRTPRAKVRRRAARESTRFMEVTPGVVGVQPGIVNEADADGKKNRALGAGLPT